MSTHMSQGRIALLSVSAAALAIAVTMMGQPVVAQGGPPQQGGPQPSPWASAPIDITGYWVSVVNEDWRWRMVTPPRGDVASIPITDAGRKAADSWDPATDGSCLAYGAAGLMRIPTRLHVTWEGDNVLKIETDAGVQTRRLVFNASAPAGARSLQGRSIAVWERPGGGGGAGGRGAVGGSLMVTTDNLSGGWLRKNGVPYSQNAKVTEYFDSFTAPNGDRWLTVTTLVEDAQYLNQTSVTSTHFKREADGAKWSPAPCKPTT